MPLRKVIASFHSQGGKVAGEPVHLWLSFEGLDLLRLSGASDGWHLNVDGTPPQPVDMGESGEIVLVDASAKTVLEPMVGQTLRRMWLVKSPEGEMIGVRLDFGLPVKPIIVNWGDEIHVVDHYPPEVVREGGILEVGVKPVAGIV